MARATDTEAESSINYLDVGINPTTYRSVTKVFTAAPSHDGDGIALRRAFPGAGLMDLDPLLLCAMAHLRVQAVDDYQQGHLGRPGPRPLTMAFADGIRPIH